MEIFIGFQSVCLRCLGKASAIVYSISETAKLNDLNPYYYFKYLLVEIPRYMDEKGDMEESNLEALLPWSERLPAKCHKPRR